MLAQLRGLPLQIARCWIAAGALLLMVSDAGADTHQWAGIFNQNFQLGANWSPSGVPVDGDTAVIGQSTANVFLSAATRVDDLTINNGALLRTNGQTLKVDDLLSLTRATGGEEVSLTLSSGASGIDLEATRTTLNNGAQIVMQSDSQWRVVESALISSGSSVSGAGIIEITGASGAGFDNNGSLTSQNLTLRLAPHAGSTFDLDGPGENGYVNVTGLLDIQTNLNDPFNARWDQQFGATAQVVDFDLGPGGRMNFRAGVTAAPTTLTGRDLEFKGELNIVLANGFDSGEVYFDADTITFGNGAIIQKAQDTELITTGRLFLGNVESHGIGSLIHYGDVTVTGHAVIDDGEFVLDFHTPRQLTIEPNASLSLLALNFQTSVIGTVSIGQNGLLDVDLPWDGVQGSIFLNGSNARLRSEFPITVTRDEDNRTVAGTGRFDVATTLDGIHLKPGNGATPGSLYFDRLTILSGTSYFDAELAAADRVVVGGEATLGGAAFVLTAPGFIPEPGTTIPLLVAGSRVGQFSNSFSGFGLEAGQFFTFHYNADSVVAYVPLVGDANLDGLVSGADYTIWADNYGTDAFWVHGDFNGDGQATGADYTLWADNFGKSVSLAAAPVAVPEPSSGWLALAAAGMLGTVVRRWSRCRRTD